MASNQLLDTLIIRLNKYKQRATYGAIGPMLGYLVSPGQKVGNLLAQRPRDQRHSWVVAKKTGLPSGYAPHQLHPDLHKSTIIDDPDVLKQWLDGHP